MWGHLVRITGTVAITSTVTSLSCASVGNCALSGYTANAQGEQTGFIASEVRGTWRAATKVGSPSLTTAVDSVSCPTAGDCTAVGENSTGAFYVSSSGGTWGSPVAVSAISGPDAGAATVLNAIDCPAVGACSTAGTYLTTSEYNPEGSQIELAFTMDEVSGTWGAPTEIANLATLNNAQQVVTVNALSCASAGNCVVGGSFSQNKTVSLYYTEPFLAIESKGAWGSAVEVPGAQDLNVNGTATVTSISCPSAGECVAAGDYGNAKKYYESFVSSEHGTSWSGAHALPIAAHYGSGFEASAIACRASTYCVVVGGATSVVGDAAYEVAGKWSAPAPPEVLQSDGISLAGVLVTSACTKNGYCVVAGGYVYKQDGEGPTGPITYELPFVKTTTLG